MAETPSMPEAIMGLIESDRRRLHTWMPCLVKSYDEAKQLVDVEPQVMIPYWDREEQKVMFEPAPRVANCPVGFFGAGGFRITLPIEPDKTTGVLLVAETPIEKWLAEGPKVVDPFWTRRHHLTDAMFLPMLKPSAHAFTDVPRSDAMTLGREKGPQIVVTTSEVQLGGTPSDPPSDHVALAPAVKNELSKLRDAMNSGFSALRTDLQSIGGHTHLLISGAVKTTGTGAGTNPDPIIVPPSTSLASLQSPQDAAAVGEVKATVTKAK